MSSNAPPTDRTAAAAPVGGAWWSARAELAMRRARPFMLRWGGIVGALTLVALLTPLIAADPRSAGGASLERAASDTLRSAQRLRASRSDLAAAESTLTAARSRPARSTALVAAPARPAASAPLVSPPPVPTASTGATAPSMPPSIAELTRRIDAARRLRTADSFLEVAAHPEVSGGPRMRAIADSVRTLQAAPADATVDPDGSERARRLSRFGVSIIAMARYRRDALLADSGIVVDSTRPAPVTAVAAPVTTPVPTPAPSPTVGADTRPASADPVAPDTARLVVTLNTAREAATSAARVHDSLVALVRVAAAGVAPAAGPSAQDFVPAAALLGLLLLGLALRFWFALRGEMRTPTLANAAEAERLTGARALTTVREGLLDGPARFKPSGVDPFRMLYLGLTATGTRARTAVVAGADAEIVAATGARLAIAAAADHRNTLIVDLDPASIPVSRTFRERAEPGLTDVMARAFAWREVARPVGSSDGLPITLLPAGTERDDAAQGDAKAQLMTEFERLRSSFELTLAVGPLASVELATQLLPASPIVLTAVIGETPLAALIASVEAQRAAGRKVAGLVMWDAPRPKLPTRAELVADLSRRKGRTPGGSFEAVRRAIDPNNSGNRRT